MANIPITTTISQELHLLARQKDISWHAAVARGVRILAGQENRIDDELKEVIEGNRKLQNRLTVMQNRIWELEQKEKQQKLPQ